MAAIRKALEEIILGRCIVVGRVPVIYKLAGTLHGQLEA
jgi:hypothetical protein